MLALCFIIFESNDRVRLGTLGAGAVLVGGLTLFPIWWGQDYSGWWRCLTGPFLCSPTTRPELQTKQELQTISFTTTQV